MRGCFFDKNSNPPILYIRECVAARKDNYTSDLESLRVMVRKRAISRMKTGTSWVFAIISACSNPSKSAFLKMSTCRKIRKWFEPRSNIPRLKVTIWVTGVLRRTVVCD